MMQNKLYTSGTIVLTFLLASFAFSSKAQTPYNGTAFSLPGIIQSEEYDLGGINKAYLDNTHGNKYGAFRHEDVDISNIPGEGFVVSDIEPGEWLVYSIHINQTGYYNLSFRYASDSPDGMIDIYTDTVLLRSDVHFFNTGSLTHWQTDLLLKNVFLTEGDQKIKIVFKSSHLALNYMEFLLLPNASENVFSPNGDGQSDHYYIKDSGVAKIYNKAGELLIQLNIPAPWDGTDAHGNLLSSGLYMIIVNEDKVIPVSIVR